MTNKEKSFKKLKAAYISSEGCKNGCEECKYHLTDKKIMKRVEKFLGYSSPEFCGAIIFRDIMDTVFGAESFEEA